MKTRPRILCISFSPIASDARVLRQIAVLAEGADVTTVGYGAHPDGVAEHIEIPVQLASLPQTLGGVALLGLRRFRLVELHAPAIKRAHELLAGREFDLIVANEARALPLAHAIAGKTPIWGDMHEWAPEERTNVLSWRLLVAPYMRWVCERYLPVTDAVTAVNSSIADLYQEHCGVTAEVVRNTRDFSNLKPSPVEAGKIRMVHSGGAVSGRGIETLISAALALDERFTLDLFLVRAKGQDAYWNMLRARANGSPRITFHDAVTPAQLPAALNPFDVAIYALPPQTTNDRLMLPNKFFDFVQARLALVFGSALETDRLIREHDLGITVDGYSAEQLVAALRGLTPESVNQFKGNAHKAARALSSTSDATVQRGIVARLLAARG